MARIVFKRGPDINAIPIKDGQLIYNTSNGETWQDVGFERINTTGVSYYPQSLTPDQQSQARQNIAAQPVGDYATSKQLDFKLSKPTIVGVAGQFAVSDGAGGIVWKTVLNSEEVKY